MGNVREKMTSPDVVMKTVRESYSSGGEGEGAIRKESHKDGWMCSSVIALFPYKRARMNMTKSEGTKKC